MESHAPDEDDDSEEAEGLRKIIHVDMDAFFASVEQRDDPGLRGLPVAVGGSRERGVVAAASYEARVYGVRSAMPSVTARRKCPYLVFVRPRFEVYKEVSLQVRAIFARHTSLIEPLSLDEAYLDVTEAACEPGAATRIAEAIRAAIKAETGLTASAGVSYNKFLAKLASDHRKPDGLFVITPRMGPRFVETLDVGRFHGIGPATAARMRRLGIETGLDLRARDLATLQRHFGKAGGYYFNIARGFDERPVRADRIRKSIGAEKTFSADVARFDEMREALQPILDKVWAAAERMEVRARTVTLKVKYADFRQITRARSLGRAVMGRGELEVVALELLHPIAEEARPVRLLGVSLSALGMGEPAPTDQIAIPFATVE